MLLAPHSLPASECLAAARRPAVPGEDLLLDLHVPALNDFLVPPTMIMESLSPGHEDHDRETKRGWYARFGVPHYWLLNGYERSLECLILDGANYALDVSGHDQQEVRPSLFPGLVIPLSKIWV